MNFLNKIKHYLYKKAQRYIKSYEGYSYDFNKNGEELILKKLKKFNFKTVFDVGANLGEWTKKATKELKNPTIHIFEISNSAFIELSVLFSNSKNIILNKIGLSDKEGDVQYKDYGTSSIVNTLILDSDFDKVSWPAWDVGNLPKIKNTKVTTGDRYCQKNSIEEIDLLKIDVEGAEDLVLKGFHQKLHEGKIKIIQFEYGYINGNSKFLIGDFYKLLSKYDYIIGPLKPNGVIFMEFNYALNNFTSGPNFIAVHKDQGEIIKAISGNIIESYPYI